MAAGRMPNSLGSETIKILLVDDSPLMRNTLRSLLERQRGWTVCDECADGREAVETAADHHDIVVMDLQMPRMNGLEAARLILKRLPAIRILMVTLFYSNQLADAARKAGIHGACSKQDMECVISAVEKLLAGGLHYPQVAAA